MLHLKFPSPLPRPSLISGTKVIVTFLYSHESNCDVWDPRLSPVEDTFDEKSGKERKKKIVPSSLSQKVENIYHQISSRSVFHRSRQKNTRQWHKNLHLKKYPCKNNLATFGLSLAFRDRRTKIFFRKLTRLTLAKVWERGGQNIIRQAERKRRITSTI